ncbi:plastocyanin/azurin family copper-binding protein [Halobacterium litoreum]|uniref:Plastocyanin/azurin family copper-binding protein n=1 Tax=Halobacterium litoreum TaxID=2039234 RepID=A0ABD5NH52_9EURY|nr:plastocyanin/azurin family copper-binding protein [Halobacterium litoreum]UHH12553.1 plastocyanin/azurin family copper-binding protein [Halobacterium litoreum]
MQDRRAFLRRCGVAAVAVASAGCIEAPAGGGGGDGTTTATTTTATTTATTTEAGNVVDVDAGPEGRLRFDPEDVDIALGDTVRWTFRSPGHNVTSLPGASEKCRNPEGAEPFASYEGDAHFSINDVGEVFEHTFEVAGEYVYVCAPHAGQGMVGTVTVSG